jgi:hypothetical protein
MILQFGIGEGNLGEGVSPRIDSYQFGEIKINGTRYRNDVIIFPNHVLSDWWREQGHSLSLKDLDDVLKNPPPLLIVGLGAQGRMKIPPSVSEALEGMGIRLIAFPTNEACEEYNRRSQEIPVVAALHITC